MKIGLSQRIILHNNRSYDSLDQGWYKYLKNHSIIPVPNRSNLEFNKIADTLDVFIITGGNDSTLRRLVEIRTHHVPEKFLQAGAHFLVKSVADLPALVQSIA